MLFMEKIELQILRNGSLVQFLSDNGLLIHRTPTKYTKLQRGQSVWQIICQFVFSRAFIDMIYG